MMLHYIFHIYKHICVSLHFRCFTTLQFFSFFPLFLSSIYIPFLSLIVAKVIHSFIYLFFHHTHSLLF
uniref:Uncharacterized protein n=1 Tax=Octopus bimaculoides TaxID=37653 RepID=A0A0L8ICD1_OCTBM